LTKGDENIQKLLKEVANSQQLAGIWLKTSQKWSKICQNWLKTVCKCSKLSKIPEKDQK
jgi:glyoxylate carboligase